MFMQLQLVDKNEELDNLLNDPYCYVHKIDVQILSTGDTIISIDYSTVDIPRKTKRIRRFRKFNLFGGVNGEMNKLMRSDGFRLLNRYYSFSEEGTVVVLDYEANKE